MFSFFCNDRGGTGTQIGCQSQRTHCRGSDSSGRTRARLHLLSVSIHVQQSWPCPQLCERVLVSIRGLPILQKRDVIALFTQQGPFLSLQKVPVGLAALLPVPQHQNLQSKSQLCLLCVCHNNTDVSIGSIVFDVM